MADYDFALWKNKDTIQYSGPGIVTATLQLQNSRAVNSVSCCMLQCTLIWLTMNYESTDSELSTLAISIYMYVC